MMDSAVQDILLVAGFFVAISVFPLVLQYSFSIRSNKWFGFILPVIVFVVSLSATYGSYVATVADGANMWRVPLVFVLINGLTAALLYVYWFCRTLERRREAKAEVKKQKKAVREAKDAARETIELK